MTRRTPARKLTLNPANWQTFEAESQQGAAMRVWFVLFCRLDEPGFPVDVFEDVDGKTFLFETRDEALAQAELCADGRAIRTVLFTAKDPS